LNERFEGRALKINWLNNPRLSSGCYALAISGGKILATEEPPTDGKSADCAKNATGAKTD
jgi:hypothetical protein